MTILVENETEKELGFDYEKIIEDVKNDKVTIDTAYGASVEEIKSIISKASDN